MTSQAKIILGIITAAAAGATIGMLCSPEKGSDLRRRISSTSDDLISQVGDLFSDGKDKINKMASKVESGIKNTKEKYT